MTERAPVTYRDAGVDIDAGEELVERIKPGVRRSMRREVLGGIGGFGALVEVPLDRYRKPVLVSGTDGVGTKLRLAIDTGRHDTVGIDLVAMCVNDVIVQGAEPLFFLDYFATGKLEVDIGARVIAGIVEGCVQAGCALVGGETAEMPGMYHGEDYDLAGFCVGIVEKDSIIDGSRTAAGDVVLGLPSSGPHSNGFSMIRKILAVSGADFEAQVDGVALVDRLMAPTRIYVKPLLAAIKATGGARGAIKALAHITGGGITENLTRVFPKNCAARVDTASWTRPAVFDWLHSEGTMSETELRRTFNCGVGFVLAVAGRDADRALTELRRLGQAPWILGEVVKGAQDVQYR